MRKPAKKTEHATKTGEHAKNFPFLAIVANRYKGEKNAKIRKKETLKTKKGLAPKKKEGIVELIE